MTTTTNHDGLDISELMGPFKLELEGTSTADLDKALEYTVLVLRAMLARRLELAQQETPEIEDLSMHLYARADSEPLYWAYPTDPNIMLGFGDSMSDAITMAKIHVDGRISASEDLRSRL